jgi:hemolysin activation/secretion protein
MYQAKPDELDDNYALYGSYEVPLWTPGLKLTGFAGYSQFDTNPVGTAPITFQGNGYFYGGRLRYNVAQWDKWFLDVVGGVTHVRSRFTPSLFEEFLRSDIRVNYWDVGAEVYRTGELDETRLAADRFTSFGGSSDAAFEKARWDTDSDFEYNVLSASRSQFFDFSRAHRLLASARWIIPNDRLTPSIMTTFGGLYSVRGYHEDEVVADGGIIASLQYEYDLLAEREDRSKNQEPMSSQKFVRRLAPVVFTDFGRAKTKNPLPDEAGIVEMASVGTGLVTTIGDHFDGAVYYGWALRGTEETDSGEGRWGASLLLRW